MTEDLTFKVVRDIGRDEVLVKADNLLVARAAFQKCVELYPDDLILLKQGIRSRSPKAK